MSKKGKKWIVLAAPCMADLVFPGQWYMIQNPHESHSKMLSDEIPPMFKPMQGGKSMASQDQLDTIQENVS